MNTTTENSTKNNTFSGLIDMHTHSYNSFDAEITFEEFAQSAKQKNIKIIAITDHCDLSNDNSKIMEDVEKSFNETAAYAEKSKDVLFLKGIEIGQGIQFREFYDEILKTFNFDFVLMSTHNLLNEEDFYFIDYDKVDISPLLDRYFNEINQSVETLDFDSLAHLTYPMRYINGNYKKSITLERHQQTIENILKTLIKREKCLEVNTGGVRKAIKQISPEYDILEKYYSLGGRLLTIGSDAHFADHLGADLEDCITRLKKIGFNKLCYFENREMKTISI